jgi:excisionase family DNA binding protein
VKTTFDELLTVAETAARLRVSKQTIYRRIAGGQISAVKLGVSPKAPLRIDASALEMFLQSTAARRP